MKAKCSNCSSYKHEPITDRAVAAREAAGSKASGPMLRAQPGGYCYLDVGVKHPHTKVPHTRSLVDADDSCADWEQKR